MINFKQFIFEFSKSKRPPKQGNEIVRIEPRVKALKPEHENEDYSTHHVVWTEDGKGYFIHKNEIHLAFGGTNKIGLKVGDSVKGDHKLYYNPEDDN